MVKIIKESINDGDFIIYRNTIKGPLYLDGLSTTFNKERAEKFPTEEEAKEALHDYIEEIVDPDAIDFKVARLNNESYLKEANSYFIYDKDPKFWISLNQSGKIESTSIGEIVDDVKPENITGFIKMNNTTYMLVKDGNSLLSYSVNTNASNKFEQR